MYPMKFPVVMARDGLVTPVTTTVTWLTGLVLVVKHELTVRFLVVEGARLQGEGQSLVPWSVSIVVVQE